MPPVFQRPHVEKVDVQGNPVNRSEIPDELIGVHLETLETLMGARERRIRSADYMRHRNRIFTIHDSVQSEGSLATEMWRQSLCHCR